MRSLPSTCRPLWRVLFFAFPCGIAASLPGCHQVFIDDADRQVAALIEARQRAALGFTSHASLGDERATLGDRSQMYSFVPSPLDSDVPAEFRVATALQSGDVAAGSGDVSSAPGDDAHDLSSPAPAGEVSEANSPPQPNAPTADDTGKRPPFTLSDALHYAMRSSRQFQTEKEMLYLAALDLTLERFLWTPRFVESALSIDYADYGQVRDFDRAMTAVSNFAVEQRLPYGGEVTARVINSLMRDLGVNVTSGETGAFILDTRLPLLRGAGPVALESRYLAERRLIYAVREFEHFRRQFLVDIAGEFFTLLSAKAQIDNAQSQADSLRVTYDRENALAQAERILQIEADRARVSLLNAENGVIVARERYNTSLDAFKIRLGMPTITPIDVAEQELDLRDPEVQMETAINTALKYRLDLVNTRDVIDDARRGVENARNGLLPDLNFNGSMAMDTEPGRPNSVSYNSERTTWRAGMSLEVPLNRVEERNDYRRNLVTLRRAEREFSEAEDRVRLEVRRALRRVQQTNTSTQIQAENIKINEFRAQLAVAQLQAGQLGSNRDVVEAEADLRNARNDHADAVADHRRAVLEFLRDTGTLRVDDDGHWFSYDAQTGERAAALAPAEAENDGQPPEETQPAQ